MYSLLELPQGHIGAQELGYQLLEEIDADCLAKIGRLAVNSRDFSMRGCVMRVAVFHCVTSFHHGIDAVLPWRLVSSTAFSVLGLFSRTARAREILTTQGWDASPLRSTAVSVPADPAILFHVSVRTLQLMPAFFPVCYRGLVGCL